MPLRATQRRKQHLPRQSHVKQVEIAFKTFLESEKSRGGVQLLSPWECGGVGVGVPPVGCVLSGVSLKPVHSVSPYAARRAFNVRGVPWVPRLRRCLSA